MPLHKDPKAGGTHRDGSQSADYCSYCFQNGAFTAPNFSAQQMQDLCIKKLQVRGMPKPLAWLFTRSIPKLKRWQKASPPISLCNF